MTSLIIELHIVVIIIVVREFKRFHDRKCQETYEQGVSDCKEDFKKEIATSIRKAFRTGIKKGKQAYLREYELESKEFINGYWDLNN